MDKGFSYYISKAFFYFHNLCFSIMRRRRTQILSFLLILCANTGVSQTIILDPNGDGGFENGNTFAANGWSVANTGQTNQWSLGTAAAGYSGARCAYLSTDGGLTYTYNITAASKVHLYRDVNLTGFASPITLQFKWKGVGETGWDFLKVYKITTSNTPSGGSSVFNPYTLLGGPYDTQPSWTTTTISLNSFAGTSIRLDFYFECGSINGTQPPQAIDNVYIYQGVSPLPIELSFFSAEYNNNEVFIKWETESEKNNDYFTIEKTQDFENIEAVATVKGNGNSVAPREYSATDAVSLNSDIYYRVRQTDFDGSSQASDWKIVAPVNKDSGLMTYPNPTSGKTSLVFFSENNEPVDVKILDFAGRPLQRHTITGTKGMNKKEIDISGVQKGCYILSLSGSGLSNGSAYSRLIKSE
jgi:hypothetical protein